MSEASYLYSLMEDVLTYVPPTAVNYEAVGDLIASIAKEGREEGFDAVVFPPSHWEGAYSWSRCTENTSLYGYWECPVVDGGVDPRRGKKGSSLSLQGRAMMWDELCCMVEAKAKGIQGVSESLSLALRGVVLGGRIPPSFVEPRLDAVTVLTLRKLSAPQTTSLPTAPSRAFFQTIASLPHLAKLSLDGCDQDVVEGLAFVWCGGDAPNFNKGNDSTLEWLEVVCNKRLVDTSVQIASVLAASTHIPSLIYLSFQFPTMTSYSTAPPDIGDLRWCADNGLRTINIASWLYSDLGVFFGHLLNERLPARFPVLGQLGIDCAPLMRCVLPVKATRKAAAVAGRPSPVTMQRLPLLHFSLKFAGVSSATSADSPRLEGMELVAACAPNLTSMVLLRARFTALAYSCMKALTSLVVFGPPSAFSDPSLNSEELLALARACGGSLRRLRLHRVGEIENTVVLSPPHGSTTDHFSALSELVVEDTDLVVAELCQGPGLSNLKKLDIRRIPSHDISSLSLPPSCTGIEDLQLSYVLPSAFLHTPAQPHLTHLTLDHTSFSDGVIECLPTVCPALESLVVQPDRGTDLPTPLVATLHPLSNMGSLSTVSLRGATLCGGEPSMFDLGPSILNLTLDDITFSDSVPEVAGGERWLSLGAHSFCCLGDAVGRSLTHLRLDGQLFPLFTAAPVSYECLESRRSLHTTSALRLLVHLRELSLSVEGVPLGAAVAPLTALPELPPSLECIDVRMGRDLVGLGGLGGCWRLRELSLFMCPKVTDASFDDLFAGGGETEGSSCHLLAAGWRRNLTSLTLTECGIRDLGAGVLSYLHYHPSEGQLCHSAAGPVNGVREAVVQGGDLVYSLPLGCHAPAPPPVALQTLSLTNCEGGLLLESLLAVPTSVVSLTLSPLPDSTTVLEALECLATRGHGWRLKELLIFRAVMQPDCEDANHRWERALSCFPNLATLEMSDSTPPIEFGPPDGAPSPMPRALALSTDRWVHRCFYKVSHYSRPCQ